MLPLAQLTSLPMMMRYEDLIRVFSNWGPPVIEKLMIYQPDPSQRLGSLFASMFGDIGDTGVTDDILFLF